MYRALYMDIEVSMGAMIRSWPKGCRTARRRRSAGLKVDVLKVERSRIGSWVSAVPRWETANGRRDVDIANRRLDAMCENGVCPFHYGTKTSA